MWQSIKCRLGRHVVDEQKSIMTELGAVFHADICKACLEPWIGPFLCNEWDENQTEVRDGTTCLHGVNPILRKGNFRLIAGSEEQLHEISSLLKERRKQGVPLPWEVKA